MGALWGALKGAAKAGGEYAVRAEEEARANRKRTLDEAREERLINLKERYRSKAAETEREFRTGEREAGQEFTAAENLLKREQQTGERLGTEEFKAGEAEVGRQFEAVQTDKKLTSAEKIAGEKAAAKDKDAGKWKITKVKGQSKIDPDTNMPIEGGEVVAITSPDTGNTYVQEGSMFRPQSGSETPMRQPKDKEGAMKALYADPEKWADVFLNTYHWLPSDLMRYIPK